MGSEDNIKTIQAIYEAFGRGDVGAILESVTDEVDWASDTSSTAAPWYGVKHGR
jgi:ketosteroid isomerase-like protein